MLSHAGARAIALLTIALAASFSEAASIRYDLRAVQDGSVGATVRDPKNVHVSSPSGVVKMQLWAMVENLNGINEDDGFKQGHLSVLSSGGSANLRGDLTTFNVPPFNSKFSRRGFQADLDGDGDLDVGDNRLGGNGDNAAALNPDAFFIPDSGYLLPATSLADPLSLWTNYPTDSKAAETFAGKDYSSFLIGSMFFGFDDIAFNSPLGTAVNVRPRIKTDQLIASRKMHGFAQDGLRVALGGEDPGVVTGEAVNIMSLSVQRVPEPSTLLLAVAGILGIALARRRLRTLRNQ